MVSEEEVGFNKIIARIIDAFDKFSVGRQARCGVSELVHTRHNNL